MRTVRIAVWGCDRVTNVRPAVLQVGSAGQITHCGRAAASCSLAVAYRCAVLLHARTQTTLNLYDFWVCNKPLRSDHRLEKSVAMWEGFAVQFQPHSKSRSVPVIDVSQSDSTRLALPFFVN